jgi:hypothetical protein
MSGFDSKQRMAANKLQEIFCGVDYADGVLAVSVMRRSPDGVAELLHSEQIELAQPAQEPVANSFEEYCNTLPPLWNTHISRTYAEQFFRAGQAAQSAQEPVAHTNCRHCGGPDNVICAGQCKQELAATTAPLPAQEPVAWMYPDDYERMLDNETFCTVYSVEVGSPTRGETTVALYTTPPKREWVGLTPEETLGFTQHEMTVVKYVSKVLQEKNK